MKIELVAEVMPPCLANSLKSDAMQTRTSVAVPGIVPRLLTREQAALYCGVSVPTFSAHCPVRPISLGPGKRLERYDIQSLDQWITILGGGAASVGRNWLAALESEHDSRSRERN